MKRQIRILGIDDSPFKFRDKKAAVVGAIVRLPNYLEGVMRTEVTVDGTDSTKILTKMVSGSIKVVMLDGIAFAGFNVIDLKELHTSLGIPVLTVTRDMPDMDKMRTALMKHFDDWRQRYALITNLELREIRTEHNPLFGCGLGLEWHEVVDLVRLSTVRGVVPEPLRMAHLISTAIVRGESYGRP